MRCYDICQMKMSEYTYLCTRTYSYIKISKALWRIVFSLLNIFIISLCLASYGASEAVYPCNVVEKIHEYFRSEMRQYL
jgi:hypothetical protein